MYLSFYGYLLMIGHVANMVNIYNSQLRGADFYITVRSQINSR